MNFLARPIVTLQEQEEAVAQLRQNTALRRYIEGIVHMVALDYLSSRQPEEAHIRIVAQVNFAQLLLAAQVQANLLPPQHTKR